MHIIHADAAEEYDESSQETPDRLCLVRWGSGGGSGSGFSDRLRRISIAPCYGVAAVWVCGSAELLCRGAEERQDGVPV
jgi:hypothetical protein